MRSHGAWMAPDSVDRAGDPAMHGARLAIELLVAAGQEPTGVGVVAQGFGHHCHRGAAAARSCGAAVAVMAEALANDGYARRLLAGGDFDREVVAMHRRITGPVDAAGSHPGALAASDRHSPVGARRQLGRGSTRRRVVAARFRPGNAWAAMSTSLARGALVPAYVGSRWLPRHVVLAIAPLDDAVRSV